MSRMLLLSLFILVMSVCCEAGSLKAGVARVDTTPDPGVSMDGPISKPGPAKGVHDRLHARALVLADDQTRIAIVVADNCMIGDDVVQAAKAQVNAASGFPVDHILISATHTHAAPRAVHISTKPVDDAYHRQLAGWIAEAILTAEKQLTAARIGYTSFKRPDLMKCRRNLCEPGSVSANPFGEVGERVKSVAGQSRAVIGPAGPVDPEFSVVSVQRSDGTPLCLLGNFSVHYCGGYSGGLISADYFGFFAEAVESKLGSNAAVVGILSNGTSGDTGSFTRSGKKHAAFEAMQVYGRMLAEDALRAIEGIEYREDLELGMLESQIELAVRKPTAARLQWAEETLAAPSKEHPHRWSRIYAQESQHLSQYPDRVTVTLQAIRIGSLAIAASPCEMFASTGLAIKDASPHEHTFTIELANGYGGYLPPRQQHELGGYETWPARSSFLEVDAERKIREELVHLLHRVRQP